VSLGEGAVCFHSGPIRGPLKGASWMGSPGAVSLQGVHWRAFIGGGSLDGFLEGAWGGPSMSPWRGSYIGVPLEEDAFACRVFHNVVPL
jgi:hypothetical protein